MSITDELRAYADSFYLFCNKDVREELNAIADRIDAEHDKALNSVDSAYDSGYNVGHDEGFASADDWLGQHEDAMAEHGWVRLPVDADGKVIHVGDELRDEWNKQNQGEVEWLMLDHEGWWLRLKTSCERFYVPEFHEWRHCHVPTVEDVLREFAHVGMRIAAKNGITAGEIDFYADEEAIAEYAAKMREVMAE